MTDESRPDDIEDPKPGQDEQSLAGTGNEEQDDLDTAREMETIVPNSAEELDSATIPGVEPGQDRITQLTEIRDVVPLRDGSVVKNKQWTFLLKLIALSTQ